MELVKLMIEIKTYGFQNEIIEYEVMRGSLETIDLFTYHYQTEKEWFNSIKKKVLVNIKNERFSRGGFIPNDIEFLRSYILKEEKKIKKTRVSCDDPFIKVSVVENETYNKEIRPLFKEINIQNQVFLLENVIKNRMFKGNLEMFYRLTCELGDWANFFDEVPEYLKEQILNGLDVNTINEIYSYLAKHDRFMALVRLLLLVQPTLKKMGEEYQKVFGVFHKHNEDEKLKLERIRMPYIDD